MLGVAVACNILLNKYSVLSQNNIFVLVYKAT